MPNALLIDKQADSLMELGEVLRACGFRVETARNLRAARKAMLKELPDLAIVDVNIDDADDEYAVFELFADSRAGQMMEVYLITDEPDFDVATRGMRVGADDCFERPVNRKRLGAKLEKLHRRLTRGEGDDDSPAGPVQGKSPAVRRVHRMIRKVAPTRASVLLYGESGTGKELIAKAIHDSSERADGPFVAMNCGAIPSELVESELFGHRKGAFTGADQSHEGFFARASGGSLFLDEITEMSADLQVKLLRVLERRTMRRVGGETDIAVDVRFIASTNREPQEAVSEGRLREDLYYRLAEFPFRVPALRERGGDIILLAETFLQEFNDQNDRRLSLSEEAQDLLKVHDWPGNVRELKNAVTRAAILASDEITPDDLPANIPSGGEIDGELVRLAVGQPLAEVERRMILATLAHYEGDKPKTAETLGISLKTLYNRLKEYGVD